MEDKCPFCGAGQDTDPGSKYVYLCRTEASGGTSNSIYLRSHVCYERQLTALQERLKKMEGLLTKATAVIDDMRITDRYHARVDFDVEELLMDLKAFLTPSQNSLADGG